MVLIVMGFGGFFVLNFSVGGVRKLSDVKESKVAVQCWSPRPFCVLKCVAVFRWQWARCSPPNGDVSKYLDFGYFPRDILVNPSYCVQFVFCYFSVIGSSHFFSQHSCLLR